jgi:putative oxidoreductase
MILRRVARPLLASIFVYGGINMLRQMEGHKQAAQPLLDKTVGKYEDSIPDSLPTDAETLIKVDAAVKIGAGAALAFGKAPRFAALLLLGTMVPTTAAGHPFWKETDPEQREAQMVQFLKNCSLAGGLLLAAADTHGKPSAAWMARHGAHMAGKRMGTAGHAAELYASHAMKRNMKQAKRRGKLAKTGLAKAGKAGKLLTRSKKPSALSKVQHAVMEAPHACTRQARKTFGKGRKSGLAKAQQSLQQTQKGLQEAQKAGMRKAQHNMKHGMKQARKSDLAKKARHSVKHARRSDLAKKAEQGMKQAQHGMHQAQHGVRQAQHSVRHAQHATQARARQVRGHARSAMSH